MNKTLGGFRAALLIGWLALGAAGLLYARFKNIPAWVAAPVLAAFLVEYPFYLVPGFAAARAHIRAQWAAGYLIVSGVLPYLIYSLGTGQFHWIALARLAVLFLALSRWYRVFRPSPAADLVFLAIPAAAILGKYFEIVYTRPIPGIPVEFLGHLALIHVASTAVLVTRGAADVHYGFLPSRSEWAVGARYFLLFVPVGIPLGLLFGLFHWNPQPWWKIGGIFFGILWVVALSEEFFFRGLLQKWLERWTARPPVALGVASAAFGLAHIGFQGFPNWRMVLLAAIAGLFYGMAWSRARSIRASMVTHALVVTLWRGLLG